MIVRKYVWKFTRYLPKDRGPKRLQSGPVVEDEVDVVEEEGTQADAEHGRHKEEEQYVELTLTLTIKGA